MRKKFTITAKGREWTKEDIKTLLETNLFAAKKALLIIYDRQTDDEKQYKETQHRNGVGFTGSDARVLTSIAECIINGKALKDKQVEEIKTRMSKYYGQIFSHMKELYCQNT